MATLLQKYKLDDNFQLFDMVINSLTCGNYSTYRDYMKSIKRNKELYKEYIKYIFENYNQEQVYSLIIEAI